MAGIATKSFDAPDERRAPDKTELQVVDLGSVKAARMTLQPGWRWSECIKPVVGTDSCQVHHVGTVASGSLHVEHEEIAGIAEGMPLEPWCFRPWDAEEGSAKGGDGEVRHEGCSGDLVGMLISQMALMRQPVGQRSEIEKMLLRVKILTTRASSPAREPQVRR